MEAGKQIPVNTQPLISVVVPAYQAAEGLGPCLDSILAQTWPNLQLILVDDGSTDGTADLADRYAAAHPDRMRVLHVPNGGVAKARLLGVEAAEGDWIGFVDADDEIEPDMYERLVKNALGCGAEISHCGYQTIVNGGERIHYFYDTGRFVQQDRSTALRDLLEGSFVEPSLCNKLFSRQLFLQASETASFDCSLRYHEDLLMNYRLFSVCSSAVYEDFCPYHYLARTTSATRKAFQTARALDPVRAWKTILQSAPPELRDVAWGRYLRCCAEARQDLYDAGVQPEEVAALKQQLLEHRGKWPLAGKKEQLRIRMIVSCPWLYGRLYRLYSRLFGKKIYE